jgi:hypothetical protein
MTIVGAIVARDAKSFLAFIVIGAHPRRGSNESVSFSGSRRAERRGHTGSCSRRRGSGIF